MSLSSISTVTITGNSRGVSVKGFGTPIVLGKHDNWVERYRSYDLATAVDTLISEGFSTYSPVVTSVRNIAASTPKTTKVIVGRLVTLFTHISTIEIKSTILAGATIAFSVRAPDGTSTSISYVVEIADTPTTIATAIAALINAVTDISSAAVGAVITNTADNNNEMWRFIGYDVTQIDYADATADSNLATELGEIKQLNFDWYGVVLADCPSKARLLVLAAYIETIDAICGSVTYDTNCLDGSSTTSIAYALNAADYFRTFTLFSDDQSADAGAAWFGKMFPYKPGAATWAYKSLSGVTISALSATHLDALEKYKCNYYVNYHDVPITREGKVASGEWIDIVIFRDWVVARITERFASLLVNSAKIPYTNKGASAVAKEVKAVLTEGVSAGGFDGDQDLIVTYPDVRTVSNANKVARILPDVYFEATFSGAIHAAQFVGYLKV